MSSTDDGGARHAAGGQRGREARRRARETRRFYLLTAASTVIPGLGLLHSRPRQAKIILGLFAALLLGALGFGLTQGFTRSAIEIAVSRRALMVVIPIIIIGAALWVYGIVRTARDNLPEGTSGRPRVAMMVFAAFACVLVAAPAAQSARYAVIQRDLIGNVFSDLRPEGATAPGEGEDPWEGVGRVNVLLVGSDAGPERDRMRPDSIMVASVDSETGETILFGIPRNLQKIPFPAGSPMADRPFESPACQGPCLMEHVWTLASDLAHDDPSTYAGVDNPGLTATKEAASGVLGLAIDYTVVIDLKGFTELVDAMGGVEINVQERVCVGCKVDEVSGTVVNTGKYIEPGVQKLNGYHALWFARSRAENVDGDFSRMRRQRCMVGALINQVNPTTMLTRYPALAKVLEENVAVDIPQQDLDEWAYLVQRIQSDGGIKSLPLTDKNVNTVNPDYDEIHAMVDEAVDPPKRTATEAPTSSTTTSPSPAPSSTTSSPTSETDELSDLAATC